MLIFLGFDPHFGAAIPRIEQFVLIPQIHLPLVVSRAQGQRRKFMKSLRIALSIGFLTALCALTFTSAFAQPEGKKSEAQMSFDKLKTLAGTWKGALTTEPPQSGML